MTLEERVSLFEDRILEAKGRLRRRARRIRRECAPSDWPRFWRELHEIAGIPPLTLS